MLQALGLAASVAGQFFGGKSKNKASKKLKGEIGKIMDRAYNQTVEDDAMNVARTRQDEARLAAASGYDFSRLRDDAIKGGFNPLTALAATGGAGYDGRGAVLTTPFLNRGEITARKAELFAGAPGQAVVDTSGYFGDALEGLGGGLFEMGAAAVQRQHEASLLRASMQGATASPGAVSGTSVSGGRRGSVPALTGAKTLTTSPISIQPSSVFSYDGVLDAVDEFGLPDREKVSDDPRATSLEDIPSNTWYDKIWIGGHEIYDWNDQASDSELGAGAMILTWPTQWLAAESAQRQAQAPFQPGYISNPMRKVPAALSPFMINPKSVPRGRGLGVPSAPIPGQTRSR